jgi:hypothetical protein
LGSGSGAEILRVVVVRAGVGSAAGTEAEGQGDVPPEVTSPVHGKVPTLHRLARGEVRVRGGVGVGLKVGLG